ncbi:hypothetical protein AURDEDRAFT_174435 [Auricularia subglabra TFB-10046 SS5]|uniref:Uncharacterized protein n=1 Tax=Auricularia subglabra (strain TFB-10046 / SS5) TaxID=717982 RepID=J0LG82_AURST|nr:hypothetical protein AURDEDRAFT_174435 [Auricularia subglabra TFB-10046 SS5]
MATNHSTATTTRAAAKAQQEMAAAAAPQTRAKTAASTSPPTDTITKATATRSGGKKTGSGTGNAAATVGAAASDGGAQPAAKFRRCVPCSMAAGEAVAFHHRNKCPLAKNNRQLQAEVESRGEQIENDVEEQIQAILAARPFSQVTAGSPLAVVSTSPPLPLEPATPPGLPMPTGTTPTGFVQPPENDFVMHGLEQVADSVMTNETAPAQLAPGKGTTPFLPTGAAATGLFVPVVDGGQNINTAPRSFTFGQVPPPQPRAPAIIPLAAPAPTHAGRAHFAFAPVQQTSFGTGGAAAPPEQPKTAMTKAPAPFTAFALPTPAQTPSTHTVEGATQQGQAMPFAQQSTAAQTRFAPPFAPPFAPSTDFAPSGLQGPWPSATVPAPSTTAASSHVLPPVTPVWPTHQEDPDTMQVDRMLLDTPLSVAGTEDPSPCKGKGKGKPKKPHAGLIPNGWKCSPTGPLQPLLAMHHNKEHQEKETIEQMGHDVNPRFMAIMQKAEFMSDNIDCWMICAALPVWGLGEMRIWENEDMARDALDFKDAFRKAMYDRLEPLRQQRLAEMKKENAEGKDRVRRAEEAVREKENEVRMAEARADLYEAESKRLKKALKVHEAKRLGEKKKSMKKKKGARAVRVVETQVP